MHKETKMIMVRQKCKKQRNPFENHSNDANAMGNKHKRFKGSIKCNYNSTQIYISYTGDEE